MSMHNIDAGRGTARLPYVDPATDAARIRAARADSARRVIDRYAAAEPDPAGWAQVRSILGLDAATTDDTAREGTP